MVFNSITVGSAVAPTIIETYFSHYLNRKPLHQKPTAHISYHEGLLLIRQFLHYASLNTVEDIQGFTSQWVPHPTWVKVDEVSIPEKNISEAAEALIAQLGHHGIDRVGGSKWWQWRREGSALEAEWIEMRGDYARRKKFGSESNRVMLYVHGGAYFFGSVDEHRYQMQRHARKLKARVFARKCASIILALLFGILITCIARYRLAPQFPFPCGLLDCLAAYLYLLTVQQPSEIILAGDSAGGGMVLSMLVTIRDRSLPAPAGAVLISPWVDLTHSFPSVAGDNSLDYIPAHGFLHKPSIAWPPPNADEMEHIAMHAVEQAVGHAMPRMSSQHDRKEATELAVHDIEVDLESHDLYPHQNDEKPIRANGASSRAGNTIPGPGHDLSIMLDGKLVEIKDQIQMYATNQMISHPLVSPALQPSLGGLPPLFILTGGGEVLRDEQIYIAHKAANPSKYPPGASYLDDDLEARETVTKWKPTDVQLQVWEDLCHVAPTLSFTRPGKYMYRSIAQFGAWALARAQKTEIDILDDDDVSIISSKTESDVEEASEGTKPTLARSTVQQATSLDSTTAPEQVGRAGDALPPFKNHMIRQRVSRYGLISALDPPSSLPALQLSPDEIGVIKEGPVRKWLAAKKEWDTKFAKEKRKVGKQRIKEMAQGYREFGDDEVPPPSALAGRRGLNMPKEGKKGKSWGMMLWSLWGSSHDEKTIEREEKADKEPEVSVVAPNDGGLARPAKLTKKQNHSRSRSRRRTVTDTGQTDDDVNENTSTAELQRLRQEQQASELSLTDLALLSPIYFPSPHQSATNTEPLSTIPTIATTDAPTATDAATTNSPVANGVAFPFKLLHRLHDNNTNASTVTLKSVAGVVAPKKEDVVNGHGEGSGTKGRERPGVERFETAREVL